MTSTGTAVSRRAVELTALGFYTVVVITTLMTVAVAYVSFASVIIMAGWFPGLKMAEWAVVAFFVLGLGFAMLRQSGDCSVFARVFRLCGWAGIFGAVLPGVFQFRGGENVTALGVFSTMIAVMGSVQYGLFNERKNSTYMEVILPIAGIMSIFSFLPRVLADTPFAERGVGIMHFVGSLAVLMFAFWALPKVWSFSKTERSGHKVVDAAQFCFTIVLGAWFYWPL